jgi:hypothetical protein
VHRRAVLVVPEGGRPHPRRSDCGAAGSTGALK